MQITVFVFIESYKADTSDIEAETIQTDNNTDTLVIVQEEFRGGQHYS